MLKLKYVQVFLEANLHRRSLNGRAGKRGLRCSCCAVNVAHCLGADSEDVSIC